MYIHMGYRLTPLLALRSTYWKMLHGSRRTRGSIRWILWILNKYEAHQGFSQ